MQVPYILTALLVTASLVAASSQDSGAQAGPGPQPVQVVAAPNQPQPFGNAPAVQQFVAAPNQPQPFGQAPNQPQPFGQAPNQAQQFGNAPNQPQPFGQAPNQPQQFGQGPSQAQQFGQAPSQPQQFGSAPNQAQQFGQAPNQPQPFGGVANAQPSEAQQQQQAGAPEQQGPQAASYYSPVPAGLIQVVGEQGPNKQQSAAFEQYGQPESASLPANYKPFGSFGLYIGGNPADGYYSNYYKALSNSVADKQQQSAGANNKQFGVSAVKPQGSSPYGAGDFYPFAYSAADFSSAQQSAFGPQAPGQAYASASGPAGEQALSYADSYAVKKVGAAYAQKEASQKEAGAPKGYQKVYVYQAPAAYPYQAAPGSPQAQQAQGPQQPAVVAYPVPVGSQLVGSQPGADGAFSPYGIYGFTKYAVKPVVNQEAAAYYYSSNQQQQQQPQHQQPNGAAYPSYKQQVYQTVPSVQQAAGQSYYPAVSFYGFPLSSFQQQQSFAQQQQQAQQQAGAQFGPAAFANQQEGGPSSYHSEAFGGPVGANVVVAASEKSEQKSPAPEKPAAAVVVPQQKKA